MVFWSSSSLGVLLLVAGTFPTQMTGDKDPLLFSAPATDVLIISGVNTCTLCTGSVHCALPSDLVQWYVVQMSSMILLQSTLLLISATLSESVVSGIELWFVVAYLQHVLINRTRN